MMPNGGFNQPFPEPSYFSLQDLRDEDEQNSPLLRLQDPILDQILEYVPLKDRLLKVRPVCHRLSDAVKRCVKSIEFLRDELDYCDDAKISFFLAVYGRNVEHINYDLFRSCSLREYTQWSWRQSVISSVTRCPQLKQLDILVCCRHRLRDGDLAVIFKQCSQLETLRMDASFINGHCFVKAPQTIRKLELECCQTLNKTGFMGMCQRLYKLTTLHCSLLPCLDEQTIKKIGDMKSLTNLSIVADPELAMNQFRLAEIRRLPRLKTLCLDGVNNVTDKFLGDLCDPNTSVAARSIEHLSVGWCRNIGPNGVAKLAGLRRLKSLNLDGVSKRDVSIGLEVLADSVPIERLLIAEDTFVSAKTVVEFVRKCTTLRTLDTSNNHRLQDGWFAENVYTARNSSMSAPRLVILTDTKSIWQHLPPYTYYNRVEIVNLNDKNPEEFVDSISPQTPQQLPRGYLIPELRRGNRYRMLDYSGLPSAESPIMFEGQDQENVAPIGALSEYGPAELARMFMDLPFQDPDWYNQMVSAFLTPPPPPFVNFEDSITIGSAGAPGPPDDKNQEKILKHSRPSRPKRQAQKERAQLRRSSGPAVSVSTSPSFTADDFPPLG